MLKKTAILFFSRSPEREIAAKQFSNQASAYQNKQIARALIRRSKRVIRQSGIPFIFDVPQQGATFEERLYQACARGFEQGYQRIIVVGNDSPGLTASHLKETERLLDQHDIVLGPATDGGIYLLGIHQAAFTQLSEKHLPWQSDILAGAIQQWVLDKGFQDVWLEALDDIDDAFDLSQFLAQHHSWLSHRIQCILLHCTFHYDEQASFVPAPTLRFILNRPPPIWS